MQITSQQFKSHAVCFAGEASVEDVFCQNFTAGVPGIGETLTVPLKDDGEDIMVTEDNRREFVDLYVDYYLNTAIHKQVMPTSCDRCPSC